MFLQHESFHGMKKASEYRHHSKECRALAVQAVSEEHRKQLLAMADTWDKLALERERSSNQATGANDDDLQQKITK